MDSKFKTGDKVRVIKYGHPYWSWQKMPGMKMLSKDKSPYWYDKSPELVGQEGVIDKVTKTQGNYKYSINGIKGKYAWYDEDQLEKVLSTPEG